MSNYIRLENETELELLWRVASDKDKNDWTWDDVAAEMNRLTGKNKGESSWRKKFKSMQRVVGAKDSNVSETNVGRILSDEDEKMRELERKKVQFRDYRNAWNKQNYADARAEEVLDILEDRLSDIGRTIFPEVVVNNPHSSEKEMVIILSDWHIGQTFKGVFGDYDSSIAEQRIGKLLKKVKETASLHNIGKAHVVCAGDMLSGNIHLSIQVTNKENVVDQIKKATELISSFCYECSKVFDTVLFYGVSGNHSRIEPNKKNAMHDERLDDIISWAVSLSLSHIQNFHWLNHRNLDTGIVDINVAGKTYIGVHGDFDALSKNGVANLTMMLGYIPYAIIRGHNHFPAVQDISGVKVVQGGSLAGSGDDHTIEMRLTGNPSQTILVCDAKGIDAIYNVELN